MTDHGALYGAIDFYREATSRGIKPIIGLEAYVAPGSRLTRERGDSSPYHLVMLARNMTGYKNLIALTTKANLEGFYYKPCMAWRTQHFLNAKSHHDVRSYCGLAGTP